MNDPMALFHGMLAGMCRSGVPLGKALRSLSAEMGRGPLREAAAAMAAEVEAGRSPAEAWAARGEVIPPLYGALVAAGAAAGDLPGTLAAVARHASLRAERTRRLRRAAAYPLAVLPGLGAVSWFLFAAILPRITGLYALVEEWSGRPFTVPAITRFFEAWPAAGIVPPALVLLLFALAGRLRSPVEGLRLPLTLADRLPVLGPLRLHAALASFSGTLALLLRRAVPLDRALELAGAAADHAGLASAAAAAAAAVRAGAPFDAAARDAGLLPPSLQWLLSGGGGEGLPAALEDVARIEEERFERGMETLTWAVEPVFQVAAGALVLLVVVVVYLPVLRMSTALVSLDRFFQ